MSLTTEAAGGLSRWVEPGASAICFNSLQPGFLDASAAVKLVVNEDGSDRLLKSFNPAGSFFITTFCLFEALGVLKRKWIKKEIMRDFLHLTHEGYEREAAAIKPVIEEMMK